MQLTRSEGNLLLSYSSTVPIKGNKTKRLKNCNDETANGFALLAYRFITRGMPEKTPLKQRQHHSSQFTL